MKLCCPGKGCANVIEHPDHERGFLLVHCPHCNRTTDHFPVPERPLKAVIAQGAARVDGGGQMKLQRRKAVA